MPRSATGRVVLGQMTHNRRSMRLQHEIGPVRRQPVLHLWACSGVWVGLTFNTSCCGGVHVRMCGLGSMCLAVSSRWTAQL